MICPSLYFSDFGLGSHRCLVIDCSVCKPITDVGASNNLPYSFSLIILFSKFSLFILHFHIKYKQYVLKNFLVFFSREIDSDIKELEDQFDEIIVDVATKRKQYPRKILECVIKTIKAKQEILVR